MVTTSHRSEVGGSFCRSFEASRQLCRIEEEVEPARSTEPCSQGWCKGCRKRKRQDSRPKKREKMPPICTGAITPAVRTRDEPSGIRNVSPAMKVKIADGNAHSKWLAGIIRICVRLGIRYWVENPDSSFLWILPECGEIFPMVHPFDFTNVIILHFQGSLAKTRSFFDGWEIGRAAKIVRS